MKRLIDAYKFDRVRAAHEPLAGLLDEILPLLPNNTVVVPIPTIATHIRIRGYDHIDLICGALAKTRALPVSHILKRTGSLQQRGHSRSERFKLAESSFRCNIGLDKQMTYLIVDDVITSGATVMYAAMALRDAGAQDVWVAVLARQPLDKS